MPNGLNGVVSSTSLHKNSASHCGTAERCGCGTTYRKWHYGMLENRH